MSSMLEAGAPMPEISLPKVGGGTLQLGGSGRWQLIIVYRGKHCPLCNKYLARLQELKSEYDAAGIEVVAVSTDPREKAEALASAHGLDVPVGYDLSIAQARDLGLYISHPRTPQETDAPYAEPGTFLVNSDGHLQIIDISNAPFSRPDLAALLRGITYIREKDYPIRGNA
ncbi:MAG: peroxiredoxin-like family protein [Alphaproteobacteria bacterium]